MIRLQTFAQKCFEMMHRSPSDRVGVDLRQGVTRVVRITRDDHGHPSTISCHTSEIDLWHSDATTRDRFSAWFGEHCGPGRNVSMVIDHPSLRIRRMDIAPMPEADLREAVRWNFREHVDCPIEQYHVDFLPIPGVDAGNLKSYMAFGCAEEAIREHVDLMKNVGLKLTSLEPAATALLQAFWTSGLLGDRRVIASLLVGEGMATFHVMSGSALLFSRPLATVTLEKVEQFLTELVVETERSLNAFFIQYGVESIDDLFLCGTAANLPGLMDHIHRSLGIPVKIFDPFSAFTGVGINMQDDTVARSAYAVATGLALE